MLPNVERSRLNGEVPPVRSDQNTVTVDLRHLDRYEIDYIQCYYYPAPWSSYRSNETIPQDDPVPDYDPSNDQSETCAMVWIEGGIYPDEQLIIHKSEYIWKRPRS
jgi:hypothetical protein